MATHRRRARLKFRLRSVAQRPLQLLELPLQGNGEAVCPHMGDRYVLQEGQVKMTPADA